MPVEGPRVGARGHRGQRALLSPRQDECVHVCVSLFVRLGECACLHVCVFACLRIWLRVWGYVCGYVLAVAFDV